MSYEGYSHIGMEIPFLAAEVAYQDILNITVDRDPSSSRTSEVDLVLESIWVSQSSYSHDFLDDT
jgi:hypothetical protein